MMSESPVEMKGVLGLCSQKCHAASLRMSSMSGGGRARLLPLMLNRPARKKVGELNPLLASSYTLYKRGRAAVGGAWERGDGGLIVLAGLAELAVFAELPGLARLVGLAGLAEFALLAEDSPDLVVWMALQMVSHPEAVARDCSGRPRTG